MITDDEDSAIYGVVVNAEEQFAVWPIRLAVPRGWTPIGPLGPKAECLRFVEQVWTDMRPLSLRRVAPGGSADRLAAAAPDPSSP